MKPKNEYRIAGDIIWIKLTQGKETCIDRADWPEVQKYRWYALRRPSGLVHVMTNIKIGDRRTTTYLHKLLLKSEKIDHEDGNGLNNRRKNLRSCSSTQNVANTGLRQDNTSGFKGVNLDRRDGIWVAELSVGGAKKYLGRFSNIIAAARAYNEAAVKYFGQFAKLNPV